MQHIYESAEHPTSWPNEKDLLPHYSYPHENHLLSPQQSSTSDPDDVSPSNDSSSMHRMNHVNPTKIIKKKKQTKKKRKDPNEPQKPVSPYALFFRDTQNDIKKKLSNPSFGEISKVVAHMWENIEPELKEQYKHKAAAAKKEYLKQLAAYRAVQVSHQSPTMPHFLSQSSLSFASAPPPSSKTSFPSTSMENSTHRRSSHTLPQYFSPSGHYSNYHHLHSYPNESVSSAAHLYSPSDHSMIFNSTYDPNNNHYSDYHPHPHSHSHHYVLQRSANESEHYSNYYSTSATTTIDPRQYTDLTSRPNEKHYDIHHHHRSSIGSQENPDNDLITVPSASSTSTAVMTNHDNDYQWNSTASASNPNQCHPKSMSSMEHANTNNEKHSLTRMCQRQGCSNPPIEHPQWDGEYCSAKCLTIFCKNAFERWLKDHQTKL